MERKTKTCSFSTFSMKGTGKKKEKIGAGPQKRNRDRKKVKKRAFSQPFTYFLTLLLWTGSSFTPSNSQTNATVEDGIRGSSVGTILCIHRCSLYRKKGKGSIPFRLKKEKIWRKKERRKKKRRIHCLALLFRFPIPFLHPSLVPEKILSKKRRHFWFERTKRSRKTVKSMRERETMKKKLWFPRESFRVQPHGLLCICKVKHEFQGFH